MPSVAQHLRSLDDRAAAKVGRVLHGLRSWSKRPTMREQLREAHEPRREFWGPRDAAANRETRPPESERVGCAGIVLVEAVTPSALANFERHRADLPLQSRQASRDGSHDSSRTRAGGWTSLGYLRLPGKFILDAARAGHDPTLPPFVDAVHLTLHHVVPSVDIGVARRVGSSRAGDGAGWGCRASRARKTLPHRSVVRRRWRRHRISAGA